MLFLQNAGRAFLFLEIAFCFDMQNFCHPVFYSDVLFSFSDDGILLRKIKH